MALLADHPIELGRIVGVVCQAMDYQLGRTFAERTGFPANKPVQALFASFNATCTFHNLTVGARGVVFGLTCCGELQL